MSIFYCKIKSFLRYRELDNFASKLTKITIFKEIQTLILSCTVDQFSVLWAKRSVMNDAITFFCRFDQNNQFKGNGGTLKIRLLQFCEVLSIHNIDVICSVVFSVKGI